MYQEIKITDEQVKLAENILLPSGKTFDPERIFFIKDLQTHDLHAVPGSGKTTALLAKLIALEQHLPFSNGSGILVISHTNAAIDEIRNKIGHFCPRLFSYPNFVGTIQGFTDTFLTIPYYQNLYRRKIVRIDDEIYNENHFPDYSLKAFLGKRNDGDKLLYKYRLREGDLLTLELENTPFVFGRSSGTYQKILAIKKQIRENGFLCFDDAYILATEYITNYPRIVDILQKRFRYAFIDEMQDMDKYQYEMLETLFGTATTMTYQRIGDKNQAIYNDESEVADIWKERNVKEINGSYRLHNQIACIVESLALNPIHVDGKKTNPDGTAINIKPKLLVYNNASKHLVIPAFAEIIKSLIDDEQINITTDNIFKAIAWTTSKPDDRPNVIKLNHYYPAYSKELVKLKINYPSLESYLHLHETGVARLASIRKSIFNGLLRVLRLESITNPENGRSFTKRTFTDHLKMNSPIVEQKFKLALYRTSKLVAEDKRPQALSFLIKMATAILKRFGVAISASKSFIYGKHTPASTPTPTASDLPPNQFKQGDILIDITTVHAVKGQTHTGTLYMESFYQRAVDGKGQYESSRIAEQLHGTVLPGNAHDFIKQSLKMAYVGFSRPTHLLCFAIQKSHFDSLYSGKPNIDRWEVKFITAQGDTQV